MVKPTIVFVPGFWEGVQIYYEIATALNSHGYNTHFAPFASTGHSSPTNPTMLDDVDAVRSIIEPLVYTGCEVLLVCHSAGGFTGSAAIEGLTLQKRKEEGKQGGVRKLVFLAAALLPEGVRHPEAMPFFDIRGGEMYCADPLNLLFNDVPASVGESWLAKMKCQPASGWADEVKYAGWKDVPSAFLVCENDTVFPAEKQLEGANMAGSEIEKCSAGHMVWLSQPETVVGFVRRAAGEEL